MRPEERIKKLTLIQKIRLCAGSDFWHTANLPEQGIAPVMMCDGPHGLRCQKKKSDMLGVNKAVPATCFPTSGITACSWDSALLGEIGRAIAMEAKAQNVAMVLGPGANIKRDPLCGRNFEYFSEDPYLSGALATAFIQKAQETGVGACVKHFALNNQEYKRGNGNSQADERTMREIYLAAFEQPVREGKPAGVMSAYNQVNGTYCSDNPYLLQEVLREQWGFEGMVVTDWGGMNDRVAAMQAGCDLMMPGGSNYMERALLQAVKEGRLSQCEIDRCALRVLRFIEQGSKVEQRPCDMQAHHRLAQKAAANSAVLLQNTDGILPLKENTRVCLLGRMAHTPRYQGTGSSRICPQKLVSATKAMPDLEYAPGYYADGSTDEKLLFQAEKLAQENEVAVIFAGLPEAWESEGFDRKNLKMPEGHLHLIERVCAVNPNTVVVLCCGGVVECPWQQQVKAILYMGLSGQAMGEAVKDLLYGYVNPSGRLAESWPYVYEDCPTAGCYRGVQNPQYREGIYVGYRYYDKAKKAVRWPFGYGLSYTEFSYSQLEIQGMQVQCRIKNVGQRPGAAVVQLYVAMPQDGLHRPIRELKAFQKVFLQPGQEETVVFCLNERSFSLWQDGWKVPRGEYRVEIAENSRQTVLSGAIALQGETICAPQNQADSWYACPKGTPKLSQWEQIYGPAMPENTLKKGSFTMNSTFLEIRRHSLLAKIFCWAAKWVLYIALGKKGRDSGEYQMLLSSCTDTPLRNLHICGRFRVNLLYWALNLINGKTKQ